MKPSLWRGFWAAWVDSLLVHTLRSSMLTGGVVMLMSSMGMWQYFASSMHAHDAQRAVAHAPAVQQPRVVVIAIDDDGYNTFFGGKSPLNRGRVRHLLEVIQQNTPSAKRVVMDVDLSPGPVADPWQEPLDRFLSQRPGLWTLPVSPNSVAATASETSAWQQTLCKAGVRFGHPLVPNEFGYPRLTHQYNGNLTDAALADAPVCGEGTQSPTLSPRPLSPGFLKAGVVVPFSGDLADLADMLRTVDPEWVWVGAAWGSTDIFATPFGDRYGVQVHAASMAGRLEQQRMVPFWAQLLVAWFFLALMTALATHWMPKVQAWMRPSHDSMSGHRFFGRAVLPLAFVVAVVASLLVLCECLAWVRALTGVWVPSATIASGVLVYMLIVWVWGREAVRPYEGGHHAWMVLFFKPMRDDLNSMAQCLRPDLAAKWLQAEPPYRRWLEFLLATASLLVQTVAPLVAVVAAFMRPL
ncbi:MAG TPA: CHASE2 domain-containing protein [Burkholderiaceae bacterium]|nr:CHASE2 domain-containing protein [Burkholderiaceae bacterium]